MDLKVGDKAPLFEATRQDGQILKLEAMKGSKVILYFYPRDNTPTCTVQACNFRDNHELLQENGYVVWGISGDGEKSHQKFIAKHQLPFDLIVDTDQKVHNLYGTWGEKKTFGKTYMGTKRTTFVIDEEGMISKIIKKVKSKEHTQQVLE
jgi:peroxiredoxin Q/BCP